MKIILNNEVFELPTKANCVDLITVLSYQTIRIAIEVNGEIIPKSQHAHTVLIQDDKVEIVKAVGGG